MAVRYAREAIDPPAFSSLVSTLQAELHNISGALSGLMPLAPQAVLGASNGHFAALRHALSDHYLALNGTPALEPRSAREAEVPAWLASESRRSCIASAEAFRTSLAAANRRLTDGAGGWRHGAIRLGGDRAGNRVYFPPVSAVRGQLEKVRLVLAGTGDPPVFKAALAYALLLNCHPFCDGNGRTARVLFNHVLRQGGMPKNVYLPLYEINNRSRGGHEIALRMAELRGEWELFLRYLLNAIQCCRDIASALYGDGLRPSPWRHSPMPELPGNAFMSAAAACFDAAAKGGFPAFLTPIAESSPVNATPYLARYGDFRERAAQWPGRRPLLTEMESVRAASEQCGIVVEAILIGGSFVDLARAEPRDLDCLMFYRKAHPDRPVQAAQLGQLQQHAKASAVDVRFIPLDGGPLPLIKSVSYFTSLFAMDKRTDAGANAGNARGLLLLDCGR